MNLKTLYLGELKQEMTPADVVAAAKTAGKTGHDFAELTVGEAKCYIAAIPATRELARFIRQIGLANRPTLPLRPDLAPRGHDSTKP